MKNMTGLAYIMYTACVLCIYCMCAAAFVM